VGGRGVHVLDLRDPGATVELAAGDDFAGQHDGEAALGGDPGDQPVVWAELAPDVRAVAGLELCGDATRLEVRGLHLDDRGGRIDRDGKRAEQHQQLVDGPVSARGERCSESAGDRLVSEGDQLEPEPGEVADRHGVQPGGVGRLIGVHVEMVCAPQRRICIGDRVATRTRDDLLGAASIDRGEKSDRPIPRLTVHCNAQHTQRPQAPPIGPRDSQSKVAACFDGRGWP
jgi:hypothetical protein